MTRLFACLGLLAVFVVVRPAFADDITTYNIDFTVSYGNQPTGSFTYDATTSQFSNFMVMVDGIHVDMTSTFNSTGAVSGDCPAASAILYLTQDGNCGSTQDNTTTWYYFFSSGFGGTFDFGEPESGLTGDTGQIQTFAPDSAAPNDEGYGFFSVTATTPEPSFLPLTAAVTLGLAIACRFRRRSSPSTQHGGCDV